MLFLDEPTIGLDPVVKENVRELIRQMNREERTTIFLTSHDVGDIEKLCRRIIIVNDGQIVLDDSVEHLKSRYPNELASTLAAWTCLGHCRTRPEAKGGRERGYFGRVAGGYHC